MSRKQLAQPHVIIKIICSPRTTVPTISSSNTTEHKDETALGTCMVLVPQEPIIYELRT